MAFIKNLRNKIELRREPSTAEGKERERREIKEGQGAFELSEKPELREIAAGSQSLKEGQMVGEEALSASVSLSAQQKLKEREKKIEKILEQDFENIYINLPAGKKQEFKRAGEETAREINLLLDKARIKVKKIINLIKRWLAIIPGINKFFLEQESKIKADEILRLKRQ